MEEWLEIEHLYPFWLINPLYWKLWRFPWTISPAIQGIPRILESFHRHHRPHLAINLTGRSQCSSSSKIYGLWFAQSLLGCDSLIEPFLGGLEGSVSPPSSPACVVRGDCEECHDATLCFWFGTAHFLGACTSLPLSQKKQTNKALYIAAPGPLHWLFLLPKGLVLKKPCMQVQFVLSSNESKKEKKKQTPSFYKDAYSLIWLQTERISYEYVKEFFWNLRKGSWGLQKVY